MCGSAGRWRTGVSPNDPVFWLHHAYVDKLWAQWQAPASRVRRTCPAAGTPDVVDLHRDHEAVERHPTPADLLDHTPLHLRRGRRLAVSDAGVAAPLPSHQPCHVQPVVLPRRCRAPRSGVGSYAATRSSVVYGTPPRSTAEVRTSVSKSVNGSPSTTVMSASLPASTVPRSSLHAEQPGGQHGHGAQGRAPGTGRPGAAPAGRCAGERPTATSGWSVPSATRPPRGQHPPVDVGLRAQRRRVGPGSGRYAGALPDERGVPGRHHGGDPGVVGQPRVRAEEWRGGERRGDRGRSRRPRVDLLHVLVGTPRRGDRVPELDALGGLQMGRQVLPELHAGREQMAARRARRAARGRTGPPPPSPSPAPVHRS